MVRINENAKANCIVSLRDAVSKPDGYVASQ